MKKIFPILLTTIFLAALVFGCTPKEDPLALTLINGDQMVELRMSDLRTLPQMQGFGGVQRSTGTVTSRAVYRGVSLNDILPKIHTGSEAVSIQVEAEDGYAITFNSNQVKNGAFLAYDPQTGSEIRTEDLNAILAYEMDGKPLNNEKDGLLRLVIVSPKDTQVTDGHWWVKKVSKIIIKPLLTEWILTLEGTLSEVMDRATFESGMTEKCHLTAYKDDMANVWTGIPLYLLVGRVDDDNVHSAGAFNDALADTGYTVELVAANGKTLQLDSMRVKRNANLLIAALMNDNPLVDKDFPLRLVGSDVSEDESLGAITTIRILPAK